jgi:PIN domain nuclease of toxin-antitoxin system
VKLLLDTQIVIWLAEGNPRISPETTALVTDSHTSRLFSAASAWEMAIKWRLKKLALPSTPELWVPTVIRELELTPLAVRHDHGARVAELPPFHNDPFDRLLIAQAMIEEATLVTADSTLTHYEIDLLSAGK